MHYNSKAPKLIITKQDERKLIIQYSIYMHLSQTIVELFKHDVDSSQYKQENHLSLIIFLNVSNICSYSESLNKNALQFISGEMITSESSVDSGY